MAKVGVDCGSCGAHLEIAATLINLVNECPECHTRLTTPVALVPAAVAPPSSVPPVFPRAAGDDLGPRIGEVHRNHGGDYGHLDNRYHNNDRRPMLIEQTDKKYKAMIVLAGVGILAGFGLVGRYPPVGVSVILVSLSALLYARASAWWHHG